MTSLVLKLVTNYILLEPICYNLTLIDKLEAYTQFAEHLKSKEKYPENIINLNYSKIKLSKHPILFILKVEKLRQQIKCYMKCISRNDLYKNICFKCQTICEHYQYNSYQKLCNECSKCEYCFRSLLEYSRGCDSCGKEMCIDCVGLTGCQTMYAVCKECFDYECNQCGNDLEFGKTYLLDEPSSSPYCEECKKLKN